MPARSWASFAIVVVFAVSVLGTSKPEDTSSDAAFKSVVAAANAPTSTTPCTGAALEALAQPDRRHLPLIDQPVAAGFTRANARKNYPDDGLWIINAPLVRDLHPKSWNVTEQSETKISSNVTRLAAYPLFALLRSDLRTLPKVNSSGDDYRGGKLTGKLIVSRMDTGAPVCAVPFAAESAPSVTFKNLTGPALEKAIREDFFEQLQKAMRAALGAVAPSFALDIGT